MTDNTKAETGEEWRRGQGGEGGRGCRGWGLPTRYRAALLGALGLLCTVGVRKSFAIVLTHVASEDSAASQEEMFFTNCTVFNTSRDQHVALGEDTMFQLHSAFYAGNAIFSVASAVLLITKVSPVRMVACAVMLSSVVTIALPYVIQTSLPLLFVLRPLQGALDGIQQPCSFAVLSAWSTARDKASIFTAFYTGAYLAPALAALLSGVTLCYVSWDSVVFGYGALGVLWSVVWVSTVYDTPRDHPSLSHTEAELHRTQGPDVGHETTTNGVPWRHILRSPAMWAVFLGVFCHTHAYAMLVVEQPQYFTNSFNIHIADIGLLTAMPHLGLSVSCLLGGMLSDRLRHCGLSATCTKKLLFSVGKGTEGACLLGLYFTSDWQTAITLITVGATVGGLAEAGYLTIPADLAPQFAGVICALVSLGGLGAFVNTIVASFILGNSKTLKDWQTLFLISGVLDLLAVLLFDLMAKAELQPWASGSPTTMTMTTTKAMTISTRRTKRRVRDLLRKLFPWGESSESESTVPILFTRSSEDTYGTDD